MKNIVKKLVDIEKEIASEKGNFKLFAFVLPEDASDYWDLLVSATWADEDSNESLKYLISKLKEKLTESELIKISKVLFIDSNNFDDNMQIRGGWEEGDFEFYGVSLKKAYMIVAPITNFKFEKSIV